MTLLESVPANLQAYAANYADQYGADEPMGGPASRYQWRYEPAYPIAAIPRDGETWEGFMRAEIEMWAEEGDPDRYEDEMKNPIREPVVLVKVEGTTYVWDGNHRIGASVITGRQTIPAVVGTPKAPREYRVSTSKKVSPRAE